MLWDRKQNQLTISSLLLTAQHNESSPRHSLEPKTLDFRWSVHCYKTRINHSILENSCNSRCLPAIVSPTPWPVFAVIFLSNCSLISVLFTIHAQHKSHCAKNTTTCSWPAKQIEELNHFSSYRFFVHFCSDAWKRIVRKNNKKKMQQSWRHYRNKRITKRKRYGNVAISEVSGGGSTSILHTSLIISASCSMQEENSFAWLYIAKIMVLLLSLFSYSYA